MNRLFSDTENELMKELVDFKKAGDLQNLQVARLLRTKLSFIALRWSVDPSPSVDVYAIANEDASNTLNLYFDIVNLVYFFQELEKIGFIKLQSIPSQNTEKQRMLFDRKKYEFNCNKNQFNEIGIDKENGILSLFKEFQFQLFGKKDNMEYASPLTLQSMPNSFAYDLDDIVYKIIYPMPVLEDYVSNGFRTIEDKRYEETSKKALKANKTANWTLVISSFAFIASALSGFITYKIGREQIETPTELSPIQIQLLDSIIRSNSVVEPMRIICNDTLNVKPIQVKKQKPHA